MFGNDGEEDVRWSLLMMEWNDGNFSSNRGLMAVLLLLLFHGW